MSWRNSFQQRNPNRQSLFDQDLQGLLTPQAAAPQAAIPTAQPKPFLGQVGQTQPQFTPHALPQPQQGSLGQPQQTLQQPSPFQGQQSFGGFGYPRSLPQTAAPQAQDNLSNWLTRMMQRSSGQQQMPGWRGGGNALAQGWRGR